MKNAPGESGTNERGTGGGGGATVWDVAARAGVSAMTVSRVINGEAHVRADKREQVLRVVRELDYRPNAFARSLSSSRRIG